MTGLSDLGLSQYEESIYKALIRLGRADAKKISVESAVPITATYPNLKTLAKKGLIQKLEGEIALYDAKDPKLALAAFLDEKKARLNDRFATAMSEISEIKKSETQQKEPVTISTGREISNKIFLELTQNTKKSLYILGWGFFKTHSDYPMLKELKKLVDQGKDIRLITSHPTPMENNMLREILGIGVSMKKQDIKNFSIVVRDGVETKITLKNPEIGPRVILHIDDPDLSGAMREYFLGIWKKARKV